MTPGSRIVIDPEQVRILATRMRGGAFILSNSGRTMAQSSLPTMPAALSARVSERICDANAALQELAIELIEDAAHLEARATWAELGGGAETAWLVPGLRRYPSLPAAPTSPTADSPALTEEQVRASQEWATEMLDGMHDGVRSSDEEIDRGHTSVIDMIETHADEIPVKPLGGFTLVAEVGGDDDTLEGGLSAGIGAFGAGISTLSSSPTGWGVVGCLLAGGLVGSSGELDGD